MTVFVSSLMDDGVFSMLSDTLGESCGDVRFLRLPEFERFDRPVAAHPDMLLFAAGRELYCHEEYYSTNKTLIDSAGADVIPVSSPARHLDDGVYRYPDDVTLNALPMTGADGAEYLLCRADAAADALKKRYGGNVVPVRQGYSRCSVCKVAPKAAITADRGLAAAMERLGCDVLTIAPGGITLDGYDTGFIGGASALIWDTLFFFGDIGTHPDGERIMAFALRYHASNQIKTASGPLRDYGGAVTVCMKDR